jgi:hypothetical protein
MEDTAPGRAAHALEQRMTPARISRVATAAATAIALAGVAGCGGDDETTSGSSGTPSPTGPWALAGTLEYEHVPYNAAAQGLDYAAITRRPIRAARVELLPADGNVPLAEVAAGADGRYSFTWEGSPRVKLWIYAEIVDPPIVIEDNTSNDAIYVLESDLADASATGQLDVIATTGWDGASYAGPRLSAPFTILDTAYQAARRFQDEIAPPPAFPPLAINWSINNSPESGSVENGQIETSYWDEEELYILGKADVDTDEFDSHVIVHEWGHYFESRLARSDSPGGGHGYGDVLDPRVALSEGWGNALSAMILDPDTIYTDAGGLQQSEGFSWDLQANDISPEAVPGWFSESTVETILFDLYDGKDEPFDQVELGLRAIYEALTIDVKETASLTTLFPLISGLRSRYPAEAASIDALVTHHTASADLGVDAVADEWGTGETHGGGIAGSLPVYADGPIGGSVALSLTGGLDFNMLAQNRYVRILGDGMPVTVVSTCASDVDLYIYRRGDVIAYAATLGGNEQVTFPTEAGEDYVVNVQGFAEPPAEYAVTLDIAH